MRIFSYDSKFSRMMMKIASCCYLNLLWVLCSLPVFTLGAATTALYAVSLKIVREEAPSLTREFFRSFRQNFKQSTVIWLILLAVGALLGVDGYVLYHLSRSAAMPLAAVWTLLLAVVIAAAVVFVIVLLNVFPLVASFYNSTGAMLKNALIIGLRYLFCSITVFAIHFAMFFAVVAIYTPLILFGEGACALLSSYFLVHVIRSCSPPKEDAEEV